MAQAQQDQVDAQQQQIAMAAGAKVAGEVHREKMQNEMRD